MDKPNYRRIYTDLLTKKHPEKITVCDFILKKEDWCALDVITLNKLIFNDKLDLKTQNVSKKYRSYSEPDIVKILNYQKKNELNNIQLAHHFGLSRNTVTKWRKLFQ